MGGVVLDVLNSVALFFRLLSVILGPLLAVVVYNIYRKTKGGSIGWLYMSVAFISLGAWSISQLVFLVVFPNFIIRVITGAMGIFLISFFCPLSAVGLAKDMKCSLPGWLTEVSVIAIGFAYYAIMYVYAFMASVDFLGSVASISIIGLTPMFILGAIGYLTIARETRVGIWSWWTLGTFFVFIGAFVIGGMYANCCGTGAPLEWSQGRGCDGWMYDYAPALPLPCVEAALPVTSNGAVILSIGLLILLYVTEMLRRAMAIPKSR
jgi:hypothetical protein